MKKKVEMVRGMKVMKTVKMAETVKVYGTWKNCRDSKGDKNSIDDREFK